MAAFHHGISAQEKTQGILPMRNANVSVIGLVVTSTDADNDMYPLDTPVLLTGITQENIDKAGTTGTLRNCLQSIRDIYNPTAVILRVTEPLNADTLDVLLTCQSRFGLMPKRLGAPEIDTPDVVLKLVSIAKRRRGMVYAQPRNVDGTLIIDKALITAYRDTYGDRELCIIDGEWGVPGKSDSGTGSTDGRTDFATLPINNSVTIDNSDGSFNNQDSFFSIEVNGVMYNADKSQDVTRLAAPDLYAQISMYRSSDGSINFSPLVTGPLEVRLSPSAAQKVYSDLYLAGEGTIESDGTFVFKLGTA
ncbi:hypothetical protein [Psychrobacter urativorans]|uniref:Phage tail protein n=1 Tax=Psychrobacter urativorans TaxID=45610 RepID=A0A0M4SYW9_9GAMM|nr:hypothetical protein [Psychrobacter urativorans]ALF60322.1 hypothetical protein AOC03_09960 [Psychrobacter urativorans]